MLMIMKRDGFIAPSVCVLTWKWILLTTKNRQPTTTTTMPAFIIIFRQSTRYFFIIGYIIIFVVSLMSKPAVGPLDREHPTVIAVFSDRMT
jgi:hypothetical protein